MRETWYVLEDGRVVDPSEVAHDEVGVMRHSSGAAVAMRGQTPSSRSVDADAERRKSQKPADPKGKGSAGKTMKPSDQQGEGYVTRESKAT
jgi:hypothetical protein